MAPFVRKAVNKVCFMHQMILQLKDALKNTFSKGRLCWHKEAAVSCLLQCWIPGLRPTWKPSPWWVSQRNLPLAATRSPLQPNPPEQSHPVPALAVLWVLQDQEPPPLLETSFSALPPCWGILSLNPLCGVLVLVQGTGTALLLTPEVFPLHWADVHRWSLTGVRSWICEGQREEPLKKGWAIRMLVCKGDFKGHQSR